MIIDAHTHIGFGKAIVATPNELITSMDRASIAAALVFAGRVNQCQTEDLIRAIENFKSRLYPIGSISPLDNERPSLEIVEQWLSKKQIYGLKFYPGYEYFYPADESVRPYLKLLEKYNRPAIFHSGDTFSKVHESKLKYAHPLHIDDLATEMPNLKIVIAHLGYPWVIDAAEVVYKNKNVYVDCSGFVYGEFKNEDKENFKTIWNEFMRVSSSPKRILFGTDWPIGEQAPYVAALKEIVGEDNDMFWHKNANNLFGFNL